MRDNYLKQLPVLFILIGAIASGALAWANMDNRSQNNHENIKRLESMFSTIQDEQRKQGKDLARLSQESVNATKTLDRILSSIEGLNQRFGRFGGSHEPLSIPEDK